MKKTILLLIIFSFLFATAIFAEESGFPESGLTPDSNFYFLKSWKESIQTFFTFGAENKAKQFLHLAEVRLAEYQKMIEKGKTEIAQKILDKYEQQLNHALEKTEEAKDQGKDVEKLKEEISEKILKHQKVLTGILEKVPEEAKKGIENAIEMSKKGLEAAAQATSEENKEAGKVCIQVITPAIDSKTNNCKEFSTPCDVPVGWKKINKCPPVSIPSTLSTPPKPLISFEPTPSEIRYYTCPDGTKVVSGKCYGEGATLRCAMKVSPELQCSAPTPPVTKGGVCATVGETKYYQCPSSSQVSQVSWCVCGPESGAVGAKNVWQCQYLPGLACPKETVTPTPIPTSIPTSLTCKSGEMKDYKCPSGNTVKWQCECTAHADGEETRLCSVKPASSCPGLGSATSLTITEITVRHLLWMTKEWTIVDHIFWKTNVPANSYVEYGLTTPYGFTAGYTASPSTPTTEHGTNALPDLQRNTTYHFRIVAEGTKGNKIVSDDYTFTTGL